MTKKKWLIVSLVVVFVITSFGTMISAKPSPSDDSSGENNVPVQVSGSTGYMFCSGTLRGTAKWTLTPMILGSAPWVDGTVTDGADIIGLAKIGGQGKLKLTRLHLTQGDTFSFWTAEGAFTDIPFKPLEGSGKFTVSANFVLYLYFRAGTFWVCDYN